jgi:gas vesicle protein
MSPFSSLAAGALGAVVGGLAVTLFGPQLAKSGRPVAKSALKTALLTLYAAQVRGAEIAEAIEDLYAEAKSEVAAEVLEAALAAVQEKTAAASAAGAASGAAASSAAKPARQRAAVKRSHVLRSKHG